MSLPKNYTPVVPEHQKGIYNDYILHSALYSGDPNRLARVYSSLVYTPTPTGSMWAEDIQNERSTALHVPIAGDIATFSSDLLFAEQPDIFIKEAQNENAPSDVVKAQNRLTEILDRSQFFNKLLEGGQSASALGGVFLKVNWDKELASYPIMSVAQADNAYPEFQWGVLTAVNFVKVIEEDGETFWRFVERHESGLIINALYKGSYNSFGVQVGLTAHPLTASLEPIVETGLSSIAVRYIPNLKPNKKYRGSDFGQSDYAGLEGLMDSLDLVYTSWMRDIKLGQGRIIVPETWLEKRDGNGNFTFNVDREVYTAMSIDEEAAGAGITLSQFAIRTDEHQRTAQDLLERIVTGAGYAPQSFGLNMNTGEASGTALNIRERKTFITKGKKERYWKSALEDICELLLEVDNLHFGSGVKPYRPTVVIKDNTQTDMGQIADTVVKLAQAGALSTEMKVRMANPDLSEQQIAMSVRAILLENGMNPELIKQLGIEE